MPSSTTILVTDGEHRAALAVTRSLGRHGFRVVVASPREVSLAGASRWAAGQIQTPEPLEDPSGFAAAIIKHAAETGARVVLPITDQSILPVLEIRDQLTAIVPFPALASWRTISDKATVAGRAETIGISVPGQRILARPESVELDALRFPVILKPARSLVMDGSTPTKHAVRYALDQPELSRVLASLPSTAFPLLMQEQIVGPGLGVFLLRWDGRLLASFAHRRLLEKPPSGGVSVCAESVGLSPELARQSLTLLEAFDWRGVAMVEYKQDRLSGRPYLMEVNGRFWGSLQLAVDAGVDFPVLLMRAALGESVMPVEHWRTGLRCRWRLGELDHLMARLRRPGRDASRRPDLPSIFTAVGHAVWPAWGPNQRGEVFRRGDPAPAIREVLEWIRGR